MVVVVSVLVVAAPPTGRMGEAESDEEPFCRVVRGVICVYLRHLRRCYEEKQREAELLLETKLRVVISTRCSIWCIYYYTVWAGKKYNAKPV